MDSISIHRILSIVKVSGVLSHLCLFFFDFLNLSESHHPLEHKSNNNLSLWPHFEHCKTFKCHFLSFVLVLLIDPQNYPYKIVYTQQPFLSSTGREPHLQASHIHLQESYVWRGQVRSMPPCLTTVSKSLYW